MKINNKTNYLSNQGGGIVCELLGERVKISGSAVKYLQGEITT